MNSNDNAREPAGPPSAGPLRAPATPNWPRRIFRNLRRNCILWLLGAAVALNLYLTLENRLGRALIIPGAADGEAIAFAKTYLFWTPDFSQARCRPGSADANQQEFHSRLEQKFGGWTRWRVAGNGPEGELEEGWFYQVSLAKSAAPVSIGDIEALLKECFRQHSYYVIENRHR
jgi:hypothetical protein